MNSEHQDSRGLTQLGQKASRTRKTEWNVGFSATPLTPWFNQLALPTDANCIIAWRLHQWVHLHQNWKLKLLLTINEGMLTLGRTLFIITQHGHIRCLYAAVIL